MITRTITTQFQTTEQNRVKGYAIRFNEPTTITEPINGKLRTFTEVVRPNSIRFENDLKLLWGHDAKNVLASRKAGTLQEIIDNQGLLFDADMPVSALREREALTRGDVDQCSFGFIINKEVWKDNVRELTDISVHEISICAWGAYPTTSASMK